MGPFHISLDKMGLDQMGLDKVGRPPSEQLVLLQNLNGFLTSVKPNSVKPNSGTSRKVSFSVANSFRFFAILPQ